MLRGVLATALRAAYAPSPTSPCLAMLHVASCSATQATGRGCGRFDGARERKRERRGEKRSLGIGVGQMILLPYSTLSVLLRTSSLLPPLFLCFSFGTKRTSVRHKENNNNNDNDRNNNNKQATQLFFFVIPCRMISARMYPEAKVLAIVIIQLRCYTNYLDDIFLLIHKSF